MSRPSQLPYVIDALVTAFTAAMLPMQVDGVTLLVLDGPSTDDPSSLDEFIVVGDEGEDESGDSAFDQSWAGLGAQAKDELGSVACVLVVNAGDDDIRARRLRAFQLFAACEAAQRADLSLGGLVIFSAIESGTYRPVSTTRGTAARVGFTVTYKARI